MIVRITDDRMYMQIHYDSQLELQQMHYSYNKRKIRNAFHKCKGKRWDGTVEFLKASGTRLPLGLWHNLTDVCERNGFQLKFEGLEQIIDSSIDKEYVTRFCISLMKGYKHSLREYQIESVYLALKYNFCLMDLATSAGKTLIMYMYLMYLKYHKMLGKALLIFPDPGLVIQTYNEFKEFSMGKFDVGVCQMHGESKPADIKPYSIVLGNFQTLINMKEDFYLPFTRLVCDEAHRAEAQSIKTIIQNCKNVKSRIGVTGSVIIDKHAEYLNLLAWFGPIVKTVTKKQLMDANFATQINISIVILNWASSNIRRQLCTMMDVKTQDGNVDGTDVFEMEQGVIRQSKARIYWIARFISKLQGNTLVFFIDKKNGYGKRIVEALKQMSNGKEIYYIDGDVDNKLREAYKIRMEQGDNKCLVASYATYSTGKSIMNLHNIVTAESMKSETVIDQATGRGMRLHETKSQFNWYDLVDDLSIKEENYNNKNYMLKHMDERIRTLDKWRSTDQWMMV